jgi:DNA polymerase-3 subunit delta
MIYIMYGKDTYTLQQDLRKVKEQYASVELMEANTSVLDGSQLTPDQFLDICNAAPFLHTHRLVIVEGLFGRFEQGVSSGRKSNRTRSRSQSEIKEWQFISDYLKAEIPDTTVLVFIDGDVNKKGNNPLLTLIGSYAQVRVYPLLKGDRLKSWVQKRVIERGGTISPAAIDLLLELTGQDLWSLNNEIDKLVAFSEGKSIKDDDVKNVTSYTGEVNIFLLVDAVLERRSKAAHELLRRLYQTGAVPSYIITMINRQLRMIVMVKDLSQRMSRTQVKSIAGIPSDMALDRTVKQAKAYSMEHIKTAYHKLLEADIAIKSGKYVDEDLTVELLVSELCGN